LSVAIGREADMQTVEWGNCIGAIDPDQITHPVAAIGVMGLSLRSKDPR
jgi:hypothetical protein